jgi:hypothetical protein
MANENLNAKLLDTAINTMNRNRTLLFTINLIAALLLTVVYLERASLDKKQRENAVIAHIRYCRTLNELLYIEFSHLHESQKQTFPTCSDLKAIKDYVAIYSRPEDDLTAISKNIFRLHRIQNELSGVKLENANATPFGFGLPVPRNDLVIICGFLLLMLYMWLVFSFNQHARILTKIKLLFPEERSVRQNEVEATINDLVELNFLFRTYKGGWVAILVRFLYLLAPLSMTAATLNDFLPDADSKYLEQLSGILTASFIIKILITATLWIIGYRIIAFDKKTNKEPKDLISLCGLRLEISKENASRILGNAVTEDSFRLTGEDILGLENKKDVKSLLLVFSENKLISIDIIYSDTIRWHSSEEFAQKLSETFGLPFGFWNISSSSSEGTLEFKDFSLKIDSETNRIILSSKTIDEEKAKKESFKF